MASATLKCHTSKIKTMDHTPGADVAVDDIVLANGVVGIAYADIDSGDTGQLIYAADDVEMPMLSTDTGSPGAKVYWDNTNSRLTTTASGNTLCGVLRQAKANGETTARIELNRV